MVKLEVMRAAICKRLHASANEFKFLHKNFKTEFHN